MSEHQSMTPEHEPEADSSERPKSRQFQRWFAGYFTPTEDRGYFVLSHNHSRRKRQIKELDRQTRRDERDARERAKDRVRRAA